MDADPKSEIRMPRGYRFDVHLHGQSHFGGRLDVVRTRLWNTCDNHIGVADRFYLLQAKALADLGIFRLWWRLCTQ